MIPARLVLDTNIVVSAALKPQGLQRTVFLLALTKPAELFVSEAILAEYREVLARPELQIQDGTLCDFRELVRDHSSVVDPPMRLRVALDPDDDMFLECADAARADYLVTGNCRHFPQFWKTTKVVTAREFVNLAAPHVLP